MKKLILPVIAVIGLCTPAMAQDPDSLVIEENGAQIIISGDDDISINGQSLQAILAEFTAGMEAAAAEFEATLEDIEAREEAGEIDEDQAEAERDAAGDAFEMRAEELAESLEEMGESMERMAESQERNWEQWADQWEKGTFPDPDSTDQAESGRNSDRRIIIGEDGIRIEDRIDDDIIWDESNGYEQESAIIGFHFGVNQLYNPDMELAAGEAEVGTFKSWTYDLELGHKVRIGQTSPLFFQYGLNFSWHSFNTKGSLTKAPDVNGDPSISFAPRAGVNVSNTEFDIVYMDIPLMLQLDFSGEDINEGFSIGVGGYGGVRIDAERETEYTDFNGDNIEETIEDNFLTNQFRYGVMGQIGWGSMKVTAKYDLSALFQDRYDTPNYQTASVTLGFVF